MFGLKFFVTLTVLSSACLIHFTQSKPLFFRSNYGIHGGYFSNLYPQSNTAQAKLDHEAMLRRLIVDRFYVNDGSVVPNMGTFS